MDFEFLKNRYDFELERKDKITTAIGLPFAILTAVGTLTVAMARNFAYQANPWLSVPLPRCSDVCALALFIASIYCLSRAYRDDTYTYLPKLAELDSARAEWRAFYRNARPGRADDDAFTRELRQHIIEAADYNTTTNDIRTA